MTDYSHDTRAVKLRAVAVFNGIIAAIALVWGLGRGSINVFAHPEPLFEDWSFSGTRLLVGLVVGWTFGAVVAWASRASVLRYRWARRLHREFKGLLGPLDHLEILVYAATAAFAEEMFFRGAMQAQLGIVLASVIFGLAHVAITRRLWLWPLEAMLMGFCFGGLFYLFGDLTAPIAAHFAINYQNLHFINRYDPADENLFSSHQ